MEIETRCFILGAEFLWWWGLVVCLVGSAILNFISKSHDIVFVLYKLILILISLLNVI